MDENPLVSIIIPTYNRAHMIGETLDSILAQTYQHWECLVIDDLSSDDTDMVMKTYCEEDTRFTYYNRPATKPKGANACRNLGLEKFQGKYVVFFDSDDFMTSEHLQVKLKAIEKHDADFIVTKTKDLSGRKFPNHYYAFNSVKLTPYNYILHHINWITMDVIIHKRILDQLWFNENLQSGQEYNFFSKLVVRTTNFHFENKEISLKRTHNDSIRKKLDNKQKLAESKFLKEIETLSDLKDKLSEDIKTHLLLHIIKVVYDRPKFVRGYHQLIFNELYKLLGFKAIYFELMLVLNKANKAYRIRNKLITALNKTL